MSMTNTSTADLQKTVDAKREELRVLRFDLAGTKKKNISKASAKKEIARALTELNTRKETPVTE